VLIDLTVEDEEDEESVEKEVEDEQLRRNELDSESEESLLTDVSSDDELEVSNIKVLLITMGY